MKKDTIIDNLSFVVGLITIILLVIFRNNLSLDILITSIGISLYGLISVFRKNRYGYFLISVGLSLLITILLYRNDILDKVDSITFMIVCSIFLLMICSFIFDYFNKKETLSIFSMTVEGELIDLKRNPNMKKDYFQPIYRYTIKKDNYVVGYPKYLNKFLPKIGSTIKIHVNPDNYEETYFDKSKLDVLYTYLISLFLLIASLIIMITLFI